MNTIPVTYRREPKCRLYNDSEKYIYGAPWMPAGVEHIINVSQGGMEMMLNEKEEGRTPPHGEPYDNARRFYRDVVEEELRDGTGVGGAPHELQSQL